ncbi:hypothetical protein RRG08_061910 [Elysia crispata]|uniref:ATP-binding cassette sub-family B member 6 N-terminal five TM domain-containing protein n=1 Tax=Elysia crispata TaxID=231223 RepID=A0AAE1D151_9GAST|nr:hypothetical protein RRG08_061910 [Elysia crispata]
MLFCENGTDWLPPWGDKGFNRCFYQSTSASIIFIFMTLGTLVQGILFYKYAILIDRRRVKKSWGYVLQVVCTAVLSLEALGHMVLYDVYLRKKELVGYQVMEAFLIIGACLLSLWLLALEKRSMLPSTPTRGQGLMLLMFWTLLFIRESLMFVSWNNTAWWWHLKNEYDRTELGLFGLRYVLVITLLILGFIGPSVQTSSYVLISDEESGQDHGNLSTWNNVWVKLKTMLPYVWPSGQKFLQVTVFLCLILLAAGRAVNVFVPIYSKKIGVFFYLLI